MFSRSMGGTDSEVSTAISTRTTAVRDLWVQLWAEHLRTPLSAQLRESLENLDLAFGVWRQEWLLPGVPATMWRKDDQPGGYRPTESVLRAVWP
jgi:hypothetical protein